MQPMKYVAPEVRYSMERTDMRTKDSHAQEHILADLKQRVFMNVMKLSPQTLLIQ